MTNAFPETGPLILGLKACDTTRKARKALPEAGFRDVREDPLTAVQIEALLAAIGPSLVNRASTTWRGLDEAERGLPEAALLAKHPALMKRPVLIEAGAARIWR